MFTNLIESNADKSAFKRRSSFFLATVAGYALFLFAAGIVGVLTYDAQVKAQTTDMQLEMWIRPVNREPDRPRPAPRPASNNNRISPRPTRPILYESVNDPIKPPDIVSANPHSIPPAPPGAVEAPYVSDPPAAPSSSPCETCTGNNTPTTPVAENRTPPPVVDPPKPTTLRVSEGVMRGNAIALPAPAYPILAKQARIQGPVNVQILIDETGKVVSAQAVKGNAMLTTAAVEAARRARFTPTKLGKEPVKVQGVITYNFVLQ
ncbi:MAG: TonB family protein [Acidobacteriota bacterium]